MPAFDLKTDAWTEVVAPGGADPQMIVVSLGEALVSIGTPDASTQAIKLGGAAGRSISEGRMLTVPAGQSVSIRPVGVQAVGYVGGARPVSPGAFAPLYALATGTDGSTGKTYSAPAGMTGVQWYREALSAPYGRTAISGATGATYAAQAADVGSRLVAVGTVSGQVREAKALHVVYSPPQRLEAYSTPGDFTPSNGAVVSGQNGALVVQGTGTASPTVTKANIGTYDPANWGTIVQFMDVGWDGATSTVSALQTRFTRDATTYPALNTTPIISPLYVTPAPIYYGSLWASQHVSEIANFASIGSGPLGLSHIVGSSTANTAYQRAMLDELLVNAGGRPTAVPGFDDIFDTQFTVAFPYMRDRGMRGCIHLVADNMNKPGRLTDAMVQEMYDAGWDVCSNTLDDGPLTSKGTVALALDNLARNIQYAKDRGWTRGNEFFAYPNGTYQNSPTRPLTNVTSNGTNVVTVASATNIIVGMTLVSRNAPAGTVVTDISGTSITLNNAIPTGTSVPSNFVDLTSEFSYGKLPLALKNAGWKMGRTTNTISGTTNKGTWHSRFGIPDRGGILTPGNPTSNVAIDVLQGQIDTAILRGDTIEFYIHGLNTAGGVNTDPTKFYALIDYIVAKRDAGLLDVLTKTELWLRDGSATVPV